MELNARAMLTLPLPYLGLVTYLCFVQGTLCDQGQIVTHNDRTKYLSFRMDFEHTVFPITNQCKQIPSVNPWQHVHHSLLISFQWNTTSHWQTVRNGWASKRVAGSESIKPYTDPWHDETFWENFCMSKTPHISVWSIWRANELWRAESTFSETSQIKGKGRELSLCLTN
jgi:hypothetical protein